MEKEFVPYEQALSLKELGFDKITFGVYYISDDKHEVVVSNGPYSYGKNTGIYKKYNVLTPTFSQAFRWFREKYLLFGYSYPNDYQKYGYRIVEMSSDGNKELVYDWGTKDSVEEAELECLKKLIKIVKEK